MFADLPKLTIARSNVHFSRCCIAVVHLKGCCDWDKPFTPFRCPVTHFGLGVICCSAARHKRVFWRQNDVDGCRRNAAHLFQAVWQAGWIDRLPVERTQLLLLLLHGTVTDADVLRLHSSLSAYPRQYADRMHDRDSRISGKHNYFSGVWSTDKTLL